MITIGGSPFDITSLSNDYPGDGVEQQILQTMAASQATYAYDYLNQLKFELSLRKAIVDAAYALNDSGLNFASFHDVRVNESYWGKTANGGFLLKQGAQPSAAIEDIFRHGGQYATECATAMMIIYYKALLDVYGADLFNKRFKQIYLMNWDVREPLLFGVGTPQKTADVLLGDRGYFANPDVDPQTPQWQGENVIILPDSLYYGHGIGLTTAPRILQALNYFRKENATQEAYFMDAVGRPNFKRLADLQAASAPRTVSMVWQPFPTAIPV